MGGKKKKNKKKKDKNAIKAKKFPASKADERGKEAMAIQPPDENPHKKVDETTIEKWLRFRPKVKKKYDTLKAASRHKK